MHTCPYEAVLRQQAEMLCDTLTKRLIRHCQAQERGIGREGLCNLWEEVCVGMRTDHPMADAYRDYLEQHLMPLVTALASSQQQVLWTVMHGDIDDASVYPSRWPDEWPIDVRRIARYVLNEHVMYQCWNYENARIRAAEGR